MMNDQDIESPIIGFSKPVTGVFVSQYYADSRFFCIYPYPLMSVQLSDVRDERRELLKE
jgi:hypothetical protein